MGNDLPDYQSQVIGVGLEATSFRSGLDADKPASPAAGDIWLARDTYYLYVCNVAGAWEKVAKLYLPLAGGTMSGAIAMGTSKITGMGDPTAAQDAATKAYTDARIPSGLIAMWHGLLANIPSGWVICDGNNGTPNLLDKFVKGVPTAATNPGTTGGEASHTLTVAELPSHRHHVYLGDTGVQYAIAAQLIGANSAQGSETDYAGSGSAHENRPPYYEVAFIMKT